MANHLYRATVLPSNLQRGRGILVKGMGKKARMPLRLKKKWHNAIWRPTVLPEANAAIKAVDVVPKLDPMTMGYMRSTSINPSPTRGVRVEVKTELDWTTNVSKPPITMARYPVNQGRCLMSAFTNFLIIEATRPKYTWKETGAKRIVVVVLHRDQTF